MFPGGVTHSASSSINCAPFSPEHIFFGRQQLRNVAQLARFLAVWQPGTEEQSGRYVVVCGDTFGDRMETDGAVGGLSCQCWRLQPSPAQPTLPALAWLCPRGHQVPVLVTITTQYGPTHVALSAFPPSTSPPPTPQPRRLMM